MTLSEHLAQEVEGFGNARLLDQTLGEMAVSDGGGAERRVGEDVAIDIESHVDAALVAVGVDDVVVRDDVGDDVRLLEEEVEEGNGLIVALRPVHGGDDGVAGEHGGPRNGEHRVPGDGGRRLQVAGADEGLHAVVEAQPGAHQRRGRVREPRRVRVARRALLRRRANRVQGRLDAQTPLPSPALGRGFFGGGEGVGTPLGDREDGACGGGGGGDTAEEQAVK